MKFIWLKYFIIICYDTFYNHNAFICVVFDFNFRVYIFNAAIYKT